MATLFEYMQFATGVYAASARNYVAPPTGWTRADWQPDQFTGFSAGCYVSGSEMVITYTGTNDKADMANWSIGLGMPMSQIYEAVDYYFACKAAHPEATSITFAGHSLGGGLASLMAVYFNKAATVFDEAPFQVAALNPFVTDTVALYMIAKGYSDSAFTNYVLSVGGAALIRESNVTNYYIDGEALNYPRFSFDTLVGNDNVFAMGNSTAASVDRHSMALMTAIQYSCEHSSAFYDAIKKLPDLVTELLDAKLFATDSRNPDKEDLLRRLLRHQLGIYDPATGTAIIAPDEMLNRFAADMNKLAQDGGLTMSDLNGQPNNFNTWNNVSKALTAFAMQMYYEDTVNATDKTKQLFTDLTKASEGSNGIRFDMHDVSKDVAAAMDTNGQVDLTKAKGYSYFETYLNMTGEFTQQERTLIKSMLPQLRDWYVQAGASGMLATDTHNRGAFMLGGKGSDALVGGSKADLLVGNAGDDLLQGGKGNDVLLGGSGNDAYVYTTGDNLDTILDSDGNGSVAMDGSLLTGGAQYGDTRVHRSADGKHTYTDVGRGLVIDGNLYIEGYQATRGNGMGLSLGGAVVEANPQTSHTFIGDYPVHTSTIAPGTEDAGWRVVRSAYNKTYRQAVDSNGNTVNVLDTYDVDYYLIDKATGNTIEGGGPERADGFGDTADNDHILAGGGNDTLNAAQGGDDILEGQAGNDIINAGAGKDILIGGTGSDILAGGSGEDRLYAGAQTTAEQAIADGNADADIADRGDWLTGEGGDYTDDNDAILCDGANDSDFEILLEWRRAA